jgi:predicted ATPase/class 3 adenylate cyclase
VQTCPNCGEENPDRFRLCGICGTKLVPDEVAAEVRKTVSIVFCDLKGSTNLGEQLDTESLREVLNVYFNAMRSVLERHGGTVEKYIGDAIMAVFGLPKLHEDDALRAVRAASEMKQTLERVNDRLEAGWGVRLQNRTGVNTGEVVAGDVSAGQRLVTGDTVNTAARLEQNAPAQEILIGEPTYRLVKDAVDVEEVEPLELKGKAERTPAYRLISVTSDEGVARRLDAPMVGRDKELKLLLDSLAEAQAGHAPRLVTVFGPAGAGKSRLLREFVHRAGNEVGVLKGRCLSYGDGITFWPLAEMVRSASAITDNDSLDQARRKLAQALGEDAADVVDRIAAAIGLSETTYPVQETFWAARRAVELLSASRPLIIFVDDIHWAEETFLDLLTYVVDSADAPVVIVCSSRPELVEDHAEWVAERPNFRRIVLDPLSEEESSRVIENLLGSANLDERVRARIIEAADGNPLFVEQMLSMLIDDALLARDTKGRWVMLSGAGSLTIPPTISALLTARLDRLGATERAVIERGAVVGQVFFRGAVEELVPDHVRPFVGPSLQNLVRKELVREHESMFAGDEAFRFVHNLIQDAAYHGLLKRSRAELHERFVDWLEAIASDRVMEFEEIRGYHLEQAYLILIQLGPTDERIGRLGSRASAYLSAAGRRAFARGDMPAAANLLRRAAALVRRGDRKRTQLLLDAGEALSELGEFGDADILLQTALEESSEFADQACEVASRIALLQLHYTSEGEGAEERLIEEVTRAVPVLEELGDHAGLARAWRLATLVHNTTLRWSAAEDAALKMIENARLAGDELMETRYQTWLAMSALYGETPVATAIELCEQLLDRTATDRKAEAVTLAVLAQLEGMRGDFDRARTHYRLSRASLVELGWNVLAALTSLNSGPIELLAGDPVAAENELRRDYEALEAMGERNYISTNAAFLAEALFEQERLEEAERFCHISRELASAEDVSSQYQWRSVQAKILARRSEFDAAEALAREAVALIRGTEEIDSQATAYADLSYVLALAGKREEELVALREARHLWTAKGNDVAAARAQHRLDELESAARPSVGV